jgi:hypothetical protein
MHGAEALARRTRPPAPRGEDHALLRRALSQDPGIRTVDGLGLAHQTWIAINQRKVPFVRSALVHDGQGDVHISPMARPFPNPSPNDADGPIPWEWRELAPTQGAPCRRFQELPNLRVLYGRLADLRCDPTVHGGIGGERHQYQSLRERCFHSDSSSTERSAHDGTANGPQSAFLQRARPNRGTRGPLPALRIVNRSVSVGESDTVVLAFRCRSRRRMLRQHRTLRPIHVHSFQSAQPVHAAQRPLHPCPG